MYRLDFGTPIKVVWAEKDGPKALDRRREFGQVGACALKTSLLRYRSGSALLYDVMIDIDEQTWRRMADFGVKTACDQTTNRVVIWECEGFDLRVSCDRLAGMVRFIDDTLTVVDGPRFEAFVVRLILEQAEAMQASEHEKQLTAPLREKISQLEEELRELYREVETLTRERNEVVSYAQDALAALKRGRVGEARRLLKSF